MKVTAVLYCEAIEPARDFRVGRLGFPKTVEVPEGDRLGFVILQNGAAEVMLQTRASVAADMPSMAEHARPGASLFIEVEDFAGILKRLEGIQPVMPVRDIFYGMREMAVREPGGKLVCFAARL
jgi:hypothetical protein